MNVTHQEQHLIFREVGLPDEAAVQRLMETNNEYTLRVLGENVAIDAARIALTALPPGANSSQKRGFGLWNRKELLALADVIVGWPRPETAHVGLLMSDSQRPREGLGRALHQHVVEELRQLGTISSLRLSIVDTNAVEAEPFWQKLGYIDSGEAAPYSAGRIQSTVRIWTRNL